MLSVNVLVVPSANVTTTFLASSTINGAVVLLVIFTPFNISLTVPLPDTLTSMQPSVKVPDKTYVPASVIVTLLFSTAAPLPLILADVCVNSIFVHSDSFHDVLISSSSSSIEISESDSLYVTDDVLTASDDEPDCVDVTVSVFVSDFALSQGIEQPATEKHVIVPAISAAVSFL